MQIHRKTPHLKAECQRRGIHPPFDNPTAAQLIPLIEESLAYHQKHFARAFEPGNGYRNEWEQINADFEQFLSQLRTAAGHPAKPAAKNPDAGSAGRSAPAESVTNAPSNPPPTNPPKNISAQNTGLSGSTVDNQPPSAGPEAVFAGSMPGFAGPTLVPAGSEPPAAARKQPEAAAKANANRAQSHQQDRPSKPNEHEQQKHQHAEEPQRHADDPHKKIKIEDYLKGDSIEAALDLRSYLAGRSPLDDLAPNEQQAIVRLLKDYHAWRVLEVVQQPRPIGLGIQTSKTALNLFARRFKAAEDEAITAVNQKAIDDLMAAANGSDDLFQTAVQRCLKTRLLLTTSQSAPDLAAIHSLVLSLTRLRKQALAEQRP